MRKINQAVTVTDTSSGPLPVAADTRGRAGRDEVDPGRSRVRKRAPVMNPIDLTAEQAAEAALLIIF